MGSTFFERSASFGGSKPGWYFGSGPQGLGYYLDENAPTISDGSMHRSKRLKGSELLELVEKGAGGVKEIDEKGLQRLLNTLEKKFNVNVEQRVKYADDPKKFMESEVELDEAVKALRAVTASAALYPLLATPEIIPIFLGLIQHQNGDIAADMIELLSELTEADAVENNEDEAIVLINALIDGGLISVLVQSLQRLDEANEDEATAVYNTLSVLENCIDVKPDVSASIAETPGILEWFFHRLSPKADVDSNKQYSSEILAVLLQSAGQKTRLEFVSLGGVDRALLSIAPYRSKASQSPEEEEFVENVFDVLCAILMENSAKVSFLENEGIELMILMLKGRTLSRTPALKCLDFATTKFNQACERAVQKGILPLLFGIFMGKVKVTGADKKKIKRHVESHKEEEETRCVSIISNLFIGLETEESRRRLVAKFLESEHEKCDKLVEIMVEFASRVASEEGRIQALFEGEDVDKDELLIARLDAGLFTLQQCALIVAELWASDHYGLRKRILMLLHRHNCTLAFIRGIISEYLESLGNIDDAPADGLDTPKRHIQRIKGCLQKLE